MFDGFGQNYKALNNITGTIGIYCWNVRYLSIDRFGNIIQLLLVFSRTTRFGCLIPNTMKSVPLRSASPHILKFNKPQSSLSDSFHVLIKRLLDICSMQSPPYPTPAPSPCCFNQASGSISVLAVRFDLADVFISGFYVLLHDPWAANIKWAIGKDDLMIDW